LVLLLGSLPGTAAPPEPPALAKTIDAAARTALDAWQAPGLALAVVRGDEVIYLGGFGVREVGKKEPVTPDTIFAIGSCSKAFTTALLASLVSDGALHWDDHVRDHLPWFRLADPLADSEVRIRDLLCHRTGLASHNLLWYHAPWPPEEVVRRAGLLPLDRSFRSAFQYQSTMFTAAGLAAASAGKKPWADLIEQRLLRPLEMKSTVLTTKAALALPDRAEPHRLEAGPADPRGRPILIPRYAMDLPDAAGSIHSTARDLANWLRFHLHRGKFRERVIVPAESLAETHKPHIPLRMPSAEQALFPDTTQHSYALAWVVWDYAGHRVLSHGGAIDGFRTQLTFLPEEQIGIVTLCNLDQTHLNLALSHTLLDILLDRPRRDWHAHFRAALAKADAERAEKEREWLAERRPGTRPSREAGAYAGEYDHPAYGRARVTVQPGGLVWKWRDFEGPLKHFHYNTFLLGVEPVGPARVVFALDAAGRVARMRVTGPHVEVEFQRSRGK
jgi:CubicO group peptidase (beta-lactamase class C family)